MHIAAFDKTALNILKEVRPHEFFCGILLTLNGQSENVVNNPYFWGNKDRMGQKWLIFASRHAKVVPPTPSPKRYLHGLP